MNDDQAKALRAAIPDTEIGKLPRITCRDCRESKATKVCSKHAKSKCAGCGNYITGAHIHLDYFGHAETTDRLLDVDPEWSWEPVGWSDDGMPLIGRQGGNLVMWGRLTVAGITRLGVGTCEAGKDDAHKELIGDFIRNASMRFGVALDLWRKSEKAETEVEHDDRHADLDAPTTVSLSREYTVVQSNATPKASPEDHIAIRNLIESLTDIQRPAFLAWWKLQHLPGIKAQDALSEDQAALVFDHFDAIAVMRDEPMTDEQVTELKKMFDAAGASVVAKTDEDQGMGPAIAAFPDSTDENGRPLPEKQASKSHVEESLGRSRDYLKNRPALGAKK